MSKVKTHITVMVELEEPADEIDVSRLSLEERYFPALENKILSVPQAMSVSFVRSQVFSPDPDMPGVMLRACPFCGRFEPVHTEDCTMEPCPDAECDLCEERAYRVICDTDRDGCGASSGWYETREDAADGWNERAAKGV